MIDEELVNPQAFALAVRSRASYLSRQTMYESQMLRPYSQLTLLLGIELEKAADMLQSRGLRGAYRWAVGYEAPSRERDKLKASLPLE